MNSPLLRFLSVAPLALAIASSCNRSAPEKETNDQDARPHFDGVSAADPVGSQQVLLSWEAAAEDDRTPPEKIVYRVYLGVGDEPVDFSQHVAVSPAGAMGVGVVDLPQGVDLKFVVRAVDEAGNEDDGDESVTLSLQDTIAPQFGGATEVVGLSSSSVEVGWEPPPAGTDFDHYLVYLAESPTPPLMAEPRRVRGDVTSATFTHLKEFTTYGAQVRAINAAGHDDRNRRIIEGMTLDETPPDFAGIDAVWAGGVDIRVSWNAASDNGTAAEDIEYSVYLGTAAEDIDYENPVASVVGQTTVVVEDLAPSTTYHFAVRARDDAVGPDGNPRPNEDTNEDTTQTTTASAKDTSSPTFAGALNATTRSSQSILVEWNDASDNTTPTEAIVYDIWFSEQAGQSAQGAPDFTSPPGANEFLLTGLQPATNYFVLVRARDIAANRDDNTSEVSAVTKADDNPPVFDGVQAVTGISATTLEVTWNAATDSSGAANVTYDVFLATSSGSQNFASPIATVVGQTSVELSGLQRETEYFVVVHAADPDGNVDENEIEASGSTLPDTTGPTLDDAPVVSALSETELSVSWSDAVDDTYTAGQLRYQVEYRPLGASTYSALPWTAAGANSATISGLTVDTQFEVRVLPRDGEPNVGSPSPVSVAKTSADSTPPGTPGAPSLSASSNSSYNFVTVDWSAVSDDQSAAADLHYEVCASTNSTGCTNSWTTWATTSPGTTQATLNYLTIDTQYWFFVRAVDEAGNRSDASNSTTDSTSPATMSAPSLNGSSTSVGVTWSATTDSVFSNLRYRVVQWEGTIELDDTACSWGESTAASYAPRTTGTTTYIKRYLGNTWARVQVIDGFGNTTWSSWSNFSTGAAAASTILQPLWNNSCNLGGCHDDSTMARWTVTTARQAPSPNGYSTAAVEEGNSTPTDSRMFNRMTSSTSPMPPGSTSPPNDLACNLYRWIANYGAD